MCEQLSTILPVAFALTQIIFSIVLAVVTAFLAFFTWQLVAEQRRQFDEANRPIIDVSLQFRGEFAYFVIENTGTKLARNIKIRMNDEFINRNGPLKQASSDECFKNLTNTDFCLSARQQFYLSLGNGWQIQEFPMANVSISYEDSHKNNYDHVALIDFQKYNFLTFVKSPVDEVNATLNKINEALIELKK